MRNKHQKTHVFTAFVNLVPFCGYFFIAGLALLVASLCGCRSQVSEQLTFRQLVLRLSDLQSLARLDVPETALASSTDPLGGNADYNHPLRLAPGGWWVLADLKGPGYVSRFWFTGGEPSHGLRLYFDNEKKPRYDTTVGRFCGSLEPFLPPLAAYENYCFYNYVPLPFQKRLIIMVKAGGYQPGGWPRVFHQINYTSLPRGSRVETFPRTLSAADLEALRTVREQWANLSSFPAPAGVQTQQAILSLPAGSAKGGSASGGQSIVFPRIAGPRIIREMRVTPEAAPPGRVLDWDSFLRAVFLRIRWDDSALTSVEAPIGDFFGNVWRRAKYQSAYFGLSSNTLISRFPMPFASSALVEFENQALHPVALSVEIITEPLTWDARYGYFHAAWRRSSPQDIGQPHVILDASGRGRYAGCLLSATSLDKNFWLLEGDEFMWRDAEEQPFWRGTGLEDYFNGGWYYQNVLTRPLHGLPFKSFFRTVQYRVHLPDAVQFRQSFRMIFERGPDNASQGWFESMAFYYLERPQAALSTVLTLPERAPPQDQFGQATIMPELFNYERFADYDGARGAIDSFLEKYPHFPFADLLRLRQVAYLEHEQGFPAAKPLYEKIGASATNAAIQQQVRSLLWFHEKPSHALLGVYCNTPTRIYLDGQLLGEEQNPERLRIIALELRPGRHVLALQAQYHAYPDWVQACLRIHSGDIFTTPDWKHRVSPAGAWTQPGYDDNDWAKVGGLGCKGPPEEPYIWLEPNAFVAMQSKAIALRCSIEWPDKSKPIVYRGVFEIKNLDR